MQILFISWEFSPNSEKSYRIIVGVKTFPVLHILFYLITYFTKSRKIVKIIIYHNICFFMVFQTKKFIHYIHITIFCVDKYKKKSGNTYYINNNANLTAPKSVSTLIDAFTTTTKHRKPPQFYFTIRNMPYWLELNRMKSQKLVANTA